MLYSGIKMSMAKSILAINGGQLKNLYDSAKWEFPYGKTYRSRSWKDYRKKQYKQ